MQEEATRIYSEWICSIKWFIKVVYRTYVLLILAKTGILEFSSFYFYFINLTVDTVTVHLILILLPSAKMSSFLVFTKNIKSDQVLELFIVIWISQNLMKKSIEIDQTCDWLSGNSFLIPKRELTFPFLFYSAFLLSFPFCL